MRILYCTTGLLRGGAEAQLVALAVRMKRRHHRVMVVSMTPITETWAALAEAGVPVLTLDMPRSRPTLRGWLKFKSICRQFQPEVVHSHMVHANLLGRSLRLTGQSMGIVSTAHSVSEGGAFRLAAYRLSDWMADLTTNVSRAAVAAYIAAGVAPSDRIAYAPNGIEFPAPVATQRAETRWALSCADTTFVWLAAGRLTAAKDYSNLLRAWALVAERTSEPRHLFIAGEGEMRDQLQREAIELGVNGTITWLGLRSDVPSLLAAADGLVMSSAWEGLPMILLEASAAGVPVVTTDVGGNREIVDNGASGYLVPARQPGALAEAMVRLMNLTPAQRACLGVRGRQIVSERYGFDGVLNRWEQIYRRVAGVDASPVV